MVYTLPSQFSLMVMSCKTEVKYQSQDIDTDIVNIHENSITKRVSYVTLSITTPTSLLHTPTHPLLNPWKPLITSPFLSHFKNVKQMDLDSNIGIGFFHLA